MRAANRNLRDHRVVGDGIVPASLDILKTVAGFACHAIGTLVMKRSRGWNYRMVS